MQLLFMSTENNTQQSAQDTRESLSVTHDAIYRKFFTEPRMVCSLLQDFISTRLALHFDFDSLQRVPTDFVSDKFTVRHGDIIWRIKLQGKHTGDISEQWYYLYLMLEFQSTVDKWMALRINAYTTLLMQELVQAKLLDDSDFLPPVLPVVLYSGTGRWTAKQSMTALTMPGLGELQKYQPQQAYFLLDGSQSPQNADSEGLASLLLRLERTDDATEVRDIFKALTVHLTGIEGTTLYRLFTELALVIMKNCKASERRIEGIEDITEKENFSMLVDNLNHMLDKLHFQGVELGKEEGIELGKVEGMELGKVEGMELGKVEGIVEGKREFLLDFARSKWGALPQPLVDSVNTIQNADMLSTLSENFFHMSSVQDFAHAVQTLLAQGSEKHM